MEISEYICVIGMALHILSQLSPMSILAKHEAYVDFRGETLVDKRELCCI